MITSHYVIYSECWKPIYMSREMSHDDMVIFADFLAKRAKSVVLVREIESYTQKVLWQRYLLHELPSFKAAWEAHQQKTSQVSKDRDGLRSTV